MLEITEAHFTLTPHLIPETTETLRSDCESQNLLIKLHNDTFIPAI